MASISVPCPKASVVPPNATLLPRQCVGFSKIPSLAKGSNQRRFPTLRAQVAIEKPSSSPVLSSTSKIDTSKIEPSNAVEESAAVPESVMAAFMAEVADIVKLVDSRDIIELQLKQKDCELIIRKKEAMPLPAPSAPFVMMQHSPQAMYAPQPPMPSAPPPPTPARASPPSLPSPSKGSKSSHPPLKCPMSGTFYRCPAPGEPPFVKVGDKVKKGQVICIIEAMKLMNEIEADQDGTLVEVIAEDGKPVSLDAPLFVIEP